MTVPNAIAWIGDDTGRIECQVLSAQIHHGRDDATSQPTASTASFELVGPLPPEAVIGARVAILAELDGTVYPRFVGEITDGGIGWDTVDIVRPTLIATGDLARLGRRLVGDVPWPQELDGDRVNRILDLAGFPPDPLLSDRGTVEVLARDVDRQYALPLASSTADDGGGILWQDRQGRILYAGALHRRGKPTTVELRACDVGLGVGWSVSLEGLANDAYVRWGVAPDGGEQPEVHAIDQASVDARGTYAASLTTAIATAVDAQKRADSIVARQSDPSWILGGIEVELAILDRVRTAALLELVEMHELLSITGLPAGSPVPSALLWVEGWRESIEGIDGVNVAWSLAYATSDYCRTAPAPFWDDVDPSVTWDALDPGRTWDKTTCLPPVPSSGRWVDVPSSSRWDATDPAISWDAWPY